MLKLTAVCQVDFLRLFLCRRSQYGLVVRWRRVLALFEFRVAKYNPACRNPNGAYTRDEWTSFSDIGQSFAGVVLTAADYQQTEDAYIAAASAFMQEGNVSALKVAGLENHDAVALAFGDGAIVPVEAACGVVRRVLREEFWCRLEADAGFVHIGWDYYMYVGVTHPCLQAAQFAQGLGLFVEPFPSPYGQCKRR